MADNIYYNFSIDNNSTTNLLADKTDTRLQPLIDKPNDYYFSCLKFSLPALSTPTLVNNSFDKYAIRINSFHGAGLYPYRNPDNSTRVTEFYGDASFPLSSSYDYNNEQDVIEAYNRTSLIAYRNYLSNFNFGYSNTLSLNGNIIANVSTVPFTVTQNIIASTSLDTISGNLGYVRLTLTPEYSELITTTASIYLESPSGKRLTVVANKSIFSYYANQTYVFEDGCFNSIDSTNLKPNLPFNDTLRFLPGIYQPREPFIGFNTCNNDALGTWKIIIQSTGDIQGINANNFKFTCAFTLELFMIPKNAFTSLPLSIFAPSLSINETNKKLKLTLHETFLTCGNNLLHSKELDRLLQFKSKTDNNPYWQRVIIPQILLTKPSPLVTSFINIEQPVSSTFQLNGIRAIQLRSNTLGIYGETSLLSNTNIIMSIDVLTTTEKDIFEFASQLENRYYDILSNSPLSDINISVWVTYDTGEEVLATIPPGSRFTALFKFTKKNSLK